MCTVPTMCNVCTALMIRRVCTAPIIHNILPVLSRCSSVINRVHCASPAPTSRPISWANLIKDTKRQARGAHSFLIFISLSPLISDTFFSIKDPKRECNATKRVLQLVLGKSGAKADDLGSRGYSEEGRAAILCAWRNRR